MKRKLFIKEFIGNKKNIIIFVTIICIILIIVGVQVMFINESIKNNSIYPDVEIYGDTEGNSFTYKLYSPIEELLSKLEQNDFSSSIKVIPSITRNIISVEQINSMNEVMYVLKGYEQSYIQNTLQDRVVKGRIPNKGTQEIIIGEYASLAFNLNVGDIIGDRKFSIGTLDGISIPITLSESLENFQFSDYKVVGILDGSIEHLNYSFILPCQFSDKSIKPNSVELYFNRPNSAKIYRGFIESVHSSENEYKIGKVNENYVSKNNLFIQITMYGIIVAFVSLVLIYLIISFLIKGMGKKLGILKALGVKDITIIKIFAGGLGILEGISFILSLIVVFIISWQLNRSVSNFLGFPVNKYSITFGTIGAQFILALIILLGVYAIIKYKITKISPKICMTKE